MIVTRCPRCEKEVLIPAGAAPEAKVRCPLCSAEYELGDAMSDLPPMLELLEAPAPVGPDVSHYPPGDDMFQEEELDMFAAGAATAEAGEEEVESSFSFDEASDSESSEPEQEGGFSFEEVSEHETPTESEELAMGEPADVSAAPSPFDFGGGGEGGGTATATKKTASTPRKKKKQKSPVMLALEVVGGGIAAVIIVQFILWWVPGIPENNRDQFGVAKLLPSPLNMVAPARFRSDADAPSTEEGSLQAAGDQRVEPPAQSGFSEFEDKFNGTGDGSDFDDQAGHDHGSEGLDVDTFAGDEHDHHAHEEEPLVDPLREAFGPGEEVELADNDSPTFDLPPIESIGPSTSAETGDLEEQELATDEFPSDDDEIDDTVGIEGVGGGAVAVEQTELDTEALKPVSVQQLVRDLNAARIAFNSRQNDQSSDVARAYYVSLCKLTESLRKLDVSAEGLTDAVLDVRSLFEKIGDSPDEFVFLGRVGAGWLNLASRESDEVVIAGTVQAIEPAGALYSTRIQIANSENTIDVLTAIDPLDLPGGLREILGSDRVYGVGSQVIIAGEIVDDPASSLTGYEGDATQAIWSVCAVEIPE